MPRAEAEAAARTRPVSTQPAERARHRLALFRSTCSSARLRTFNPLYTEAPGALIGQFRRLHSRHPRQPRIPRPSAQRGKFFHAAENRELDLMLIDYADPARNVYEVTEEFYWHNGRYGNREDVVFLINGIPVVVVECKNANKDEGIALGIDQIRRYHDETPELLRVPKWPSPPPTRWASTTARPGTPSTQHLPLEARAGRASWKPKSRASSPSRTC